MDLTAARAELTRMGIAYTQLEPMREKDGVLLARVRGGDGGPSVLKCFAKAEYRREIANYRLLQDLGIRTLRILAETETALLLEDVAESETLRLGVDADLRDPMVAVELAAWYRSLHRAGEAYLAETGVVLYDETDVLTAPNLREIARVTGTEELPVWALVFGRLDEILARVAALPRTLTYNDFYFTNLIVAQDRSAAFMYDHNLLGKGYAYSDLRNVCSSLGEDTGAAFLEAYGPFDRAEIAVDDVVSVLVSLHFACQQPAFPSWADDELALLRDGFHARVEALIAS